MVSVAGWQEQTQVNALDLAGDLDAVGCRRIIFTDVSRDGALSGPNVDAVRLMAQGVRASVIASGGVSQVGDIVALAGLAPLGVEGVIVGKALYDGRLDLKAALEALDAARPRP